MVDPTCISVWEKVGLFLQNFVKSKLNREKHLHFHQMSAKVAGGGQRFPDVSEKEGV